MGLAKETAMMDLYAYNRLTLSCIETKEFKSAFFSVLLRDYCLIFEEIENVFSDSKIIHRNVNRIRQNIKLFGQRGKLGNKDIYEKIRKFHEKSFDEYENNMGFLLVDNKILGSTFYSAFVFLGSEYENPFLTMRDKDYEEQMKSFLTKTIPDTFMLTAHFMDDCDEEIANDFIETVDIRGELAVKNFDVRIDKFFSDETSLAYQTMQFRLLIALQELNFMIFVYDNFIDRENRSFIDEYTYNRILTKGIDAILKNINNLSIYSKKEFALWMDVLDEDLKHKILSISKDEQLLKWTSKYRNMIHYDAISKGPFVNFLEVMKYNSDFKEKCYKMHLEIVLPIQQAIEEIIFVSKKQQYSSTKIRTLKILRLIKEKINQNVD